MTEPPRSPWIILFLKEVIPLVWPTFWMYISMWYFHVSFFNNQQFDHWYFRKCRNHITKNAYIRGYVWESRRKMKSPSSDWKPTLKPFEKNQAGCIWFLYKFSPGHVLPSCAGSEIRLGTETSKDRLLNSRKICSRIGRYIKCDALLSGIMYVLRKFYDVRK